MKLFAVGKQTNGWGGHQWQAYQVVAPDEASAIRLVDEYAGHGYWADHPDQPTVVTMAESIELAAGMPEVMQLDPLNERDIFPPNVPTQTRRVI